MTIETCQVCTFDSIVLAIMSVDLMLVIEVVVPLLFPQTKHKEDIKLLIKTAVKDLLKYPMHVNCFIDYITYPQKLLKLTMSCH